MKTKYSLDEKLAFVYMGLLLLASVALVLL